MVTLTKEDVINGIEAAKKQSCIWEVNLMNDCFWSMGEMCVKNECKCIHYVSINSEKGKELEDEYSSKVEEALVPVRNEFTIKHY